MNKKPQFEPITKQETQIYRNLFSKYPYFKTFIDYVFEHTETVVWVNSPTHPEAAYFYWRTDLPVRRKSEKSRLQGSICSDD